MKSTKTLWLAILWVLSLGLAATLALSAEPMARLKAVTVMQEKDKVKIKAEELPANVKTTLGTDAYKGWNVVSAYKVKNGELFEVELKKGDVTQAVKFDKEGKVK